MVEQLQTRYLEQIQKHRVELDTLKVEQAKYLITQNPSPLKSVQKLKIGKVIYGREHLKVRTFRYSYWNWRKTIPCRIEGA